MPDGTKGFVATAYPPFKEVGYPEDADFFDTKHQWYIRAVVLNQFVTWQWYCWISEEWVTTIDPADWPMDLNFKLLKNPKLDWSEFSERVGRNWPVSILKVRVGERRWRWPFVRGTGRKLLTLTKELSIMQKLYLCWFRGFERDPDSNEFTFIKTRHKA